MIKSGGHGPPRSSEIVWLSFRDLFRKLDSILLSPIVLKYKEVSKSMACSALDFALWMNLDHERRPGEGSVT